MEIELDNLNREEEILYNKLLEYVSLMTDEEQREFCKLLSEYVDIQIEIEKYCNQ